MAHSQFELLKQRRFLPFFLTQALGAFNDNVFRNAMLALMVYQMGLSTEQSTLYANLAPALFILPYFLFSATAGQIAALKSPAVNVRALGFMKLRDAGTASIAPVSALLNDRNPYIRGRAVFLLAHLGAPGLAKTEEQLTHADPLLRIAAFRALRRANYHGRLTVEADWTDLPNQVAPALAALRTQLRDSGY